MDHGNHQGVSRPGTPQHWTLERLKREYMLEVVRQTRGRTTEAARILGIDRRTLATRLERHLEAGALEG